MHSCRQRCNQLRTCRRCRFRRLPRTGRHRLARLRRRRQCCWLCRQLHSFPRRHPRSRHRRQASCPPTLRLNLRCPRFLPSHRSLRCRCSRCYLRWLPARRYRRCPRQLPAHLKQRSHRLLSARLRRRCLRFRCYLRSARLPRRWQPCHRGRRLRGADWTLRTSTTQCQEQQ